MNKRLKKKKTLTQIKPLRLLKSDSIISSPSVCLFINTILSERWKIVDKIGQGSFGLIYVVQDLLCKEKHQNYALKVENLHSLNLSYSLLQKEAKILAKLESETGFPKCIKYFPEYSNNCLVMSLLGENLNSLMKKCGGNFSLKTSLMLGYILLTRIESLHNKGLLHRDIKPENIVIGKDAEYNKIFLIDFGLSKPYLDENGVHINMVEKKGLVGTARYASVNAHKGTELGRRDDIESLIYVIVYLTNGTLPWQNIPGDTRDLKYVNILKVKEDTNTEELCQGLPLEFSILLKYVKSLQFEEAPNYKFMKSLFVTMVENKKFLMDFNWDWCEFYSKNKERIMMSENAIIDMEKNTAIETAIKEKVGLSLTNIENNAEKENLRVPFSIVSLGTSKMAHFTRCDLEDVECEEREIDRFFKKENIKPKFF